MLLELEAVGLACLTLALAGPVSAALARARWPMRSPRAALLLWQAVGLGGGLGILTAGLTLAVASTGEHGPPGLGVVAVQWSQVSALGWVAIAWTVFVGAWMVTVAAASTARVLQSRHAHRWSLDMISDATRLDPPNRLARGGLAVQLVDDPRAVAYCLPGLRPRVVLSSGALRALDAGELSAVVAHERAHADGHHDLITQPFVAWAQTFPFLATARRAVAAVSLLVEILADDTALRRCRPEDLRRALRRLADEQIAATGPTAADLRQQLATRADRLATPAATLPGSVSALIYAAAATLVVAPPIILLFS